MSSARTWKVSSVWYVRGDQQEGPLPSHCCCGRLCRRKGAPFIEKPPDFLACYPSPKRPSLSDIQELAGKGNLLQVVPFVKDFSGVLVRLTTCQRLTNSLPKLSLITLCCTVLYCIVLYCIVLYCTVLYCTLLYCIALYCTVLYCTACQWQKNKALGLPTSVGLEKRKT